jgi:hypothetical protein
MSVLTMRCRASCILPSKAEEVITRLRRLVNLSLQTQRCLIPEVRLQSVSHRIKFRGDYIPLCWLLLAWLGGVNVYVSR